MSNFKLNLPTDIPWERICVTEDMIDPVVCDRRLPAKWQTSMAVFKFKPEDEYQLFPNYDITYLKVTATITGYQPLDKEIQGKIKWGGVDASTSFSNEVLKDLLNSYHPCNGAILQVVVGPHGKKPDLPLKDYPFFMDFEPKKRELYELATDTKERSSRSIESLNITKSAGSTQSLEILDIDMGGGGFGMNASYAGTGGGFSYQAPNGQWGTKRINADESLTSRSSDVGQEKRETFAFSTHISQMYNLLNSYHTGTNRVVFFVQPRPHTLEEPSGFVRGPRPVEGIQEFFMVVAQPKDQKDFCVSLRLDTSHLTKTPVMDYERKSDISEMANAVAPIPTKNDEKAEKIVGARACFLWECWDVEYQCYITKAADQKIYNPPPGFRIESFNDLVNQNSNGSSSVQITPNGSSLTIQAQAQGRNCFELGLLEGGQVCANCPDEIQKRGGFARRQVQVNLISTSPTQQVGEEEVLMITTRGLCCCSNQIDRFHIDEFLVGIKPIPGNLSVEKYLDKFKFASSSSSSSDLQLNKSAEERHEHTRGTCKECEDKIKKLQMHEKPDVKYTIRLANELSNFIKTETIKSLNDPTAELRKFYETDFFAKQLEFKLVQYNVGKQLLNEGIEKDVPKEIIPKLEKHFGKKAKEITHRDLLSLRAERLANVTGLKPEDIRLLKLNLMGVKFNPEDPKENHRQNRGNRSSKK
ncbi:MAG: hypothetical protein JJU28_15130 [Cyclobacteriaceae bacterium]|nr:hypothetical protein [Cyclobacteriaceae bacterium]